MDQVAYEVESAIETDHWWFVGRRRLFGRMIRELNLPSGAAVLDVGTSSGTNLRLLGELGMRNVVGVDSHEEAIKWCDLKGLGKVRLADVCDLPFDDATFDLVLATDIIEHVDDDQRALHEIRRVLKPGGRAIVTVPAFRSLWGMQDEIAHHKRRYRRDEVVTRARQCGFRIEEAFYFNYLLFAPIWLARQIIRITRPAIKSENAVNNAFINRVLLGVFSFDVMTARAVKPPFGVSVLALLSR